MKIDKPPIQSYQISDCCWSEAQDIKEPRHLPMMTYKAKMMIGKSQSNVLIKHANGLKCWNGICKFHTLNFSMCRFIYWQKRAYKTVYYPLQIHLINLNQNLINLLINKISRYAYLKFLYIRENCKTIFLKTGKKIEIF